MSDEQEELFLANWWEHKTTGEGIVELLCDGKTVKQIKSDLELTNYEFERALSLITREALLHLPKREYPARKADVLANVALWRAYRIRREEDKQAYLASLIKFPF